MEDAAEAIKIAGFTLLFVTALSIAMITVMQGKRTSEAIISYSDKTKYYSPVEQQIDTSGNGILTNNEGNRIVNIYDIIPTLYRYKQEEYIVLFENSARQPLQIYDGETNINKSDHTKKISYLNYNLEDKLQEEWTRNNDTVKKHVDDVVKYLLENYENEKFIETIGTEQNIYYNNAGLKEELNKENEEVIRVITYTLSS